jgi:hypothetical protein
MHCFRALCCLLVACVAGAYDPGAPNGKEHVLFFQSEYAGRIAENLTATIVIPRHVTLGDTPKSIDRVENYDFALDGTTLQFPETSGLTISSRRQTKRQPLRWCSRRIASRMPPRREIDFLLWVPCCSAGLLAKFAPAECHKQQKQ